MASRKKKASTTLSLDLQDQKAGAQPRLAKIPQNVTVRQMELKDVSAAFHLGEICECERMTVKLCSTRI